MSFLNDEQLKYLNGIGLRGTQSSKQTTNRNSELENLLRNDPIAADMYSYGAGGALQQGANSETAGNGFLGWLKDSADAGAASVVGGTARTLGEFMPFGQEAFNSAADYMDEVARRNSPTEELTGMNYVASAIGNALGSGGATMAETAALIGAGKLLGLGGLASGALGLASKTPGLGTLINAGKTMWQSPYGKYLVANVAGSPLEAVAESGNLITDMRNENAQAGYSKYSDEEIRNAALRSAGLNTAWLTAANMLEAGALGKITGALAGNVGERTAKQIARQAILGGGSSAISEGGEEYFQNLIGDYSKRGNVKDLNYDEALEAAQMGAIGGGVLGGIGAGGSAFFAKSNKPKGDIAEEVTSEGETQNTEENFWDNKDNARKAIKDAYSNGMLSKDDARNLLIKLDNGEIGPEAEKVQKERAKQTEQLLEKQRLQGYDDELNQYTDSKSVVEETAPSPAPEPVIQGLTQQQGPQLFDNTLSNVFAQADKDKENAAREAFRQAILGTPTGKGVMPEIINPITGDAFSQPFRLGTITKATQNKALGATPSAYTSRKAMATGNAANQAINFPAQAGLNQSNMPIGSAQNLRQQVNAANLALAANRGATDKTAFQQQPAQQPSDVNATADRLMAEQAITNLFDNARLLPPEYYANRDAQQQAQAELAERRKALANILGNVATQKWDETQQEYGNRRQQALQNIANIVNARAAGKWDKIEGTNASKQQSVQGIANIVNALAAGRFDKAEADSKANVDAKERQKAAQAIANIVNARAAGMWDSKEAENQAKAEARQAIADIVNARAAQQWDNAEKGKQNEKTEQKRETAKNTQGAKAEEKQNAQADKNVKKPKEEKPVEQKPKEEKPVEQKPKEEVPKAENDNKINLPEGVTVEVSYNEEKNGVQLKFNKAPGNDVTSKLGQAGFKWSRKNQLWYSLRNNPKAMEIAKQFEGAKEKPIPKITSDMIDIASDGNLANSSFVTDQLRSFREDENAIIEYLQEKGWEKEQESGTSQLIYRMQKKVTKETFDFVKGLTGAPIKINGFDDAVASYDEFVKYIDDFKARDKDKQRKIKEAIQARAAQSSNPKVELVQDGKRIKISFSKAPLKEAKELLIENGFIHPDGENYWHHPKDEQGMKVARMFDPEWARHYLNPATNKQDLTTEQDKLDFKREEMTEAFGKLLGIDSVMSYDDAVKKFGVIYLDRSQVVLHIPNEKLYFIVDKYDEQDTAKHGMKYHVDVFDDKGHYDANNVFDAKNEDVVAERVRNPKGENKPMQWQGHTPEDWMLKEEGRTITDWRGEKSTIDNISYSGGQWWATFDNGSTMSMESLEEYNRQLQNLTNNKEKALALTEKPQTQATATTFKDNPESLINEDALSKMSLSELNAINDMFNNGKDRNKAKEIVRQALLDNNGNSKLQTAARNNNLQDFKMVYNKAVDNFMVDNLEKYPFFEKLLNENTFAEKEMGKAAEEAYKLFRAGMENDNQDVVKSKVEKSTKEVTDNGNNEGRYSEVSGGQVSEGSSRSQEKRNLEQTGTGQLYVGEQQVQRPKTEHPEERPNTEGRNNDGGLPENPRSGKSSAGTAERGNDVLTPAQKKDAKASEIPGHNYTITEKSLGEGGPKTKYENNIKAIKLLKKLEAEGRLATPSEQKILAKYVGWGGLSSVFSINASGNAMDSTWTKEAKEIKELLTPAEYKAARASTNTAFYTPIGVIKNIYKMLDRLGFKSGKILEPSMGTGNFFGVMPKGMKENSALNGVEIDPLTAKIAKQLYQKANIEQTGYEGTKYPDNFFDVVISNVPFGVSIYDPKYAKYNFKSHNYFFAKAMDQVRPGGLVCFVTSTDTMQGSQDSKRLRELLKGKADLIAAVRLPNTTFKSNAGTEVTSDIIILQKREPSAAPSKNTQAWLETVDSGVKNSWGQPLPINEYYANHPEMLIGELKAGGQWGSLILDGAGVDVEQAMQKLVSKLPKDIYKPRTSTRNTNSIESAKTFLAPSKSREGTLLVHTDGLVYQNNQGKMEALGETAQAKAKDYIQLRDTVKTLLQAQVDPQTTDEQLDKQRAKLNEVYDNFVKKHGYVNAPKNISSLSIDPDYGIIESIEDYQVDPLDKKKVTAKKRAVFTQRTVNPVIEVTKADNINDALSLSLSNTGNVDLAYISKLLGGQSESSIVEELGDRVYNNPVTEGYELAEEYLSGNVREKLEIAEMAAKANPAYKRNVEALKKVQPKDLQQEDVSIGLGTPWIPTSDIQQFAADLLNTRRDALNIRYVPQTGSWLVDWGWVDYNTKNGVENTQTWGTADKSFKELLSHALNQSTPTVKHKDDNGNYIVDSKATLAAQAKLKEIQVKFKDWIWQDKNRADRLLAYYNRNYNNWVLREYDGSALTFPGYSTAEPALKDHQKNAVWRIIQDGTALIAHCVGSGKTWTMQTAAMELKRLGLANKSMFVIPNHMLQQFENEFRRIYPNAKLLTLSNDTLPDVNVPGASKMKPLELKRRRALKNAKRQATLSKIATEDWDGIIISHNLFKRIPMSPTKYNEFYEAQLAELEQALIEAKQESKGKDPSVKELEKAKKSLETKLKRDIKEEEKDIVIPFEQLGIDQIFVDEADMFKNLYFPTKMTRIAGMSNTNSQRSMDMFMKTQYIQGANNGRGVVFATGTPISNTMAEMFTMLRYLDMKGLKEKNLGFFDNWAATFATKETATELAPDGSGYRSVEKFTKFNNMPELIKMFRKVADVKKREDLDIKVPDLKNNKPTVIEVPMNSALKTYIEEEASKRANAIHNKQVDPTEDNMLKLTGDLRKASLDIRLVDPTVPASVAGAKVQAVIDHTYAKYEETADKKGVQLIFCDLSTPKGASDKELINDTEEVEEQEDNTNITVYEEIKKGLIKKGIPANQIAFIHDAKTKSAKEQLFERCRRGDIRVLIGSTEKMGAGTNIQNKLVALHHVDAPWRPRDIEQREGRILRQGNENEEVEIFNYVTKGSFDANMWEKIKNKATMIGQAMSGDLTQRTLEDTDATVLSFAEIEALASGNPLMAERVMVNAKLNQYSALADNYKKDQAKNKRELATLPITLKVLEEKMQGAKEDIKKRIDIKGDNFSIQIGGTTYDSRTKAKEAIEKSIDNVSLPTIKLGGFDVKGKIYLKGEAFKDAYGNVHRAEMTTYRAEVIGKNVYPCEYTLGSMEYTVMNMPDKIYVSAKNGIESTQKRIKAIEAELNKPFKYQEEYEKLQKRSDEIEAELQKMNEAPSAEDIARQALELLNKNDAPSNDGVTQYSVAQTAYHGTNRIFNKFTMDHLRQGSGGLTHGYGLYFAKDEKVANAYRTETAGDSAGMEFTIDGVRYRYDREAETFIGTNDREISVNGNSAENLLANALYMTEDKADAIAYLKENSDGSAAYRRAISLAENGNIKITKAGATYETLIPGNDELLDEDKTFSQQPKAVQQGLQKAFAEVGASREFNTIKAQNSYGADIYTKLMQAIMGDNTEIDDNTDFIESNIDAAHQASELLNKNGIKGLRYWEKGDKDAFVVFSDEAIKIQRQYLVEQGQEFITPPAQDRKGKLAAQAVMDMLKNANINVITDKAAITEALAGDLQQESAADKVEKLIISYPEGDRAPDLTTKIAPLTDAQGNIIYDKPMYTVEFFGEKPKGYKPKKVGKAYKLMELWPDGTLHPLFAGVTKSFKLGEWNWAQGFAVDKNDNADAKADTSNIRGMKLAPRYGWHMGTGLPASYHLMSVGDTLNPVIGYNSHGAGHPKGSKRVWAEVEYDATNDYTDIALKNPDSKEKDIRGLVPFGGYYMFQEGNLSNWIIASSIKFNKILSEDERQAMLQEAGYNEELVWRKQVLTKNLKMANTRANKKLNGEAVLAKGETLDSVRKGIERRNAILAENEARIKELNNGKDWKYTKRTAEELAAERERIRKEVYDNPELNDTQFLRTSVGEVYGFTKGGKIYVDNDLLNANTPIHEYTHIWDKVLQKRNPALWKRGVELMKRTPLWQQIKENPAYANIADNENLLGSEVHARLAGKDGAAILEQMANDENTTKGVIANLKKWLQGFWYFLRSAFSKWTDADIQKVSLEDFARMPLVDLVKGTKLNELLADNADNVTYDVTNNRITGETLVPIIDVTGLPRLDTTSNNVRKEISQGLQGKTFRIIGSDGIGRVQNIDTGMHLARSKKDDQQHIPVRQRLMSIIDQVLNNAIYIDKHPDVVHGHPTKKFIELYSCVKYKNNLIRFRILAEEGDRNAGEYEVKDAKFYDLIKNGNVSVNTPKSVLPAGESNKVSQVQDAQNIPSAISVADLLTGVKDRKRKPYVNKYGGLNYNPNVTQFQVEHVKPSKIASAFTNTERKGAIQSAKDFFKEHWNSFYSDYVDKNDVLHAFDGLTKAKGGLTLYEQVQNLPSTTAGFLKAISEGTAKHIDVANQHLKNVKMKHRVTLAMALNAINKETMDKAHPDYLKQNGFDSWVNAFGAYLGAERLLEMNAIAKAQGEEYKLPKGLTEAELRQFVRNAPVEFKKAADIFYKVNDNMISVMEDAGVFSHELAQVLRTKYKKYCPLLRDFSDTAAADSFINGLTSGGRGIGNVSIPLKKISISGSERGVLNPLETVLKSYAVMLNRAERNKVGLMAVNTAKEAGMEDIIQEVPEVIGKNGEVVNAVADPKNCVFTVLVNGKKKAYKTTQELYGPIVGYNLPSAGLVFGVARTAAKMLRTGATMSPGFILRNVIRDTVFAGISSKNGFIPVLDSIRGAIALKTDPALMAEFEAAGVTEFNFYSSQEQRIKSIDAMAGEKPVTWVEMIKMVLSKGDMAEAAKFIFNKLESYSDFAESSTRMGEFMKARKKGLSIEEAARAAREVTLDFSRSGRVGEQINQVVPFFNACIQGSDKMRRLFKEDFRGTCVKLFKYIVLPSLFLWCINHDDDWYKDLDPDIKNNYWCLGKNIRIPKPQEAGVIFGSGFEALLDQANGKDPEAMKNWSKTVLSNMMPGIVPTLFLPLLEWQANYSYFKGRPLVSNKYQRLPDELQYTDYTSELSKSIGNNPVYKVSPIKVDNLVRGYTGTMGALLWSLPDYATDKAKNQPAKNWYEYAPFRDFAVTDANLSRPLNDFYGMLDAANRQHAGYGVKGKPTQAVQAIRKTGVMISNIRKDIDKITKSKLAPERKRQLIDQRKAKMNQLAKQANERYGKYFD